MAGKGKGPSLWDLFKRASLVTEVDSEIEEEEETEDEYLEALEEDS